MPVRIALSFSQTLPNSKTASPRQTETEISISGDEFHYVKNVRRLSLGDTLFVQNVDDGSCYSAAVAALTSETMTLFLLAHAPLLEPLPIDLFSAVIRLKKMEEIVEKATELGVRSINFFLGERSQIPSGGVSALQQKHDRFERIIQSAVQQSGFQSRNPELRFLEDLPKTVESLGPKTPKQLRLTLHPGGPEAASLGTLVEELGVRQRLSSQAAEDTCKNLSLHSQDIPLENTEKSVDFLLIVGPEGGFTESELSLLSAHSFRSLSLGQKTLRSETAAVVACGMVSALLVR